MRLRSYSLWRSRAYMALMWLAFLLPSQFIFDEDLRSRQKIKSLAFNQRATLYDNKGQISQQLQERLYIKVASKTGPAELKIETIYPTTPQVSRVRLLLRGDQLWQEPSRLKSLPTADFWLYFYLFSNSDELTNLFNQQRLAWQQRQLVIVNSRPVYQLGDAKQWLWFDQEPPHLLGYRLGRVTVRWDMTPAWNDDLYLPRKIQIFDDDVLVEEREISTPRVNNLDETSMFLPPNALDQAIANRDMLSTIRNLQQLRAYDR